MNGPPWFVEPNTTVLLVVDMQNDFVLPGAPMEVPLAKQQVPNQQALISVCRSVGIPVVFTKHLLFDSFDISPLETTYIPTLQHRGMRAGSRGAEIIDELTPRPDDFVVHKHRYDAFHNTQLKSVLSTIRGLNAVDTVIILGTITEVCCESTARSAYMNDYKVLFVEDATGAVSESGRLATLDVIKTFFGRVEPTQELADELHRGHQRALSSADGSS